MTNETQKPVTPASAPAAKPSSAPQQNQGDHKPAGDKSGGQQK
jgi:hypothetical protein